MQILSGSIFRSLFAPTTIIIFALVFLLWLAQSLRFLDMVSAKGIDFWMIVEFTINLLPSFINIVLPLAVVVAVSYHYHKLLCDNEIIVMRSVGLSYVDICMPAIKYGIIMTIIGLALSCFLAPLANKNFQDKKAFIQHQYAAMVIQEGVFIEPVKGLTIYIDKVINDSAFKGILISDQRKSVNNLLVMAEEARLIKENNNVYFELINGIRQEFKNDKIGNLYFKTFPFNVSHYVKSSKREWIDPEERNILQLFSKERLKPGLEGKVNAEFNNRIFWPLLSFIMAALASTIIATSEYNRYGYAKRIIYLAITSSTIIALQIASNVMVARLIWFNFLSLILSILSMLMIVVIMKRAK